MDMNMRPDTQEAAMARADLYKMANYSFKLFKMIRDGDQLEGWVQAKITKAADYVASVYHYLEYEMKFSEYGAAIENSDMYSESVKKEFKAKLMEAKKKLEKLKNVDEGWDDMMKSVKDKEKGTGKFDKKEIKPGVTQYTRKSSTFTDGGDDSDVKKAKKAKKADESVNKSDIPAYKRKAKGGDWKVSTKDLEDEKTKSPTSSAGLARRKKELGMSEAAKAKKDYDGDGKVEAPKDEVWGSRAKAAAKAGKPFKEAAKPDFLDMDKDGNKKEPMKKAVKDKAVKEAAKCNHTAEGKSCPVHGMKECGGMYEASHQAKTTMKHVKNPTAGEKKAAKDIKPGIKGYSDRVAMLKSAEKDGRLKEGSKNLKQQAAIAIAKKKAK